MPLFDLKAIPIVNDIDEFNNHLINLEANFSFENYIREVQSRYYLNVNLMLLDELSQYATRKNEYCIDGRLYYKFKNINNEKYNFDINTCDPYRHLGRIISNAKMIEAKLNNNNILNVINNQRAIDGALANINNYTNGDYIIIDINCVREHGGGNHGNLYMFKPDSFYEFILDTTDRNRKSRQIITKYVSFINTCIYYDSFIRQTIEYNKSQRAIDDLNKQLNEIKLDMKELKHINNDQTQRMDKLLNYSNDCNKEIRHLNVKVDNVTELIYEQTEKLNIDPDDTNLVHHFIVLKHPTDNELRVIKGQLKYINRQLKIYNNYEEILGLKYSPNPIDLKVRVKQKIDQINKNEMDEIYEQFRNNEISYEERNDLVYEYKQNPKINMVFTTIHFNPEYYTPESIKNMIQDINNERYDIPNLD